VREERGERESKTHKHTQKHLSDSSYHISISHWRKSRENGSRHRRCKQKRKIERERERLNGIRFIRGCKSYGKFVYALFSKLTSTPQTTDDRGRMNTLIRIRQDIKSA
jgi:hypothetical protein